MYCYCVYLGCFIVVLMLYVVVWCVVWFAQSSFDVVLFIVCVFVFCGFRGVMCCGCVLISVCCVLLLCCLFMKCRLCCVWYFEAFLRC